MAIDTSAMSAQVELISDKLITKAIANAKTASLLIASGNNQSGVKSTAAVLKMSANILIQDGNSCSRNALDSTVFGESQISVAPMKINDNICAKNFYATYLQAKVSKGQNDETIDGALVEKIVEKKVEAIAASNEKLLWSGDKSITGTTNSLRFIDGIRKQVKTGSGSTLTVTGSTLQKLQSAFLQTNIDVRHDEDFFIFMGEDTYDSLQMNLSTLNIFKPVEDGKLYGSSAKFQVVPGLNGTNEVFLGKLEHLQMATDGEGDSEEASLVWSVETKSWYLDFAWSLGVKVIYPDQFAYAVAV